jgi:bacillithiol system protein YtxJ
MSQNPSVNAGGFVELPDLDSLDRFMAGSNGAPAIIFKHSNLCGISARAHAEMAHIPLPIGLVTVQTARDVSNEIEARTGVEHETPQVFVMKEGKVLWSASHGRITAAAVSAAISEVSAERAPEENG